VSPKQNNPMGRVTITFYPSDRKQSKTTLQIPIYLRIRKERLKTEARTDWSISPDERTLWNKIMQRIDIEEILDTYENGRQDLYRNMERLESTPATMDLMNSLGPILLNPNLHKENKEKLTRQEEKQLILFYDCLKREVGELGFNLWGVLNGVTRYTSNHLTGNKGFGVVNGRGERLNRQAMKYLMSLT
jgi:hypothetical protein